jgi:hypothetical protein
MATGPVQVYAQFIKNVLLGNLSTDTGTFRAMMVGTAYTPDMDVDEFIDDGPRANERTGTNWAADGQTVTLTVTVDAAGDQVEVEISDVSVPTVTLTDGKYAVVYLDSGTDSTSYLVCYVTYDTALAPTAGTLALTFPAPSFSFDY